MQTAINTRWVAERFGVDDSGVRKMVLRGDLPASRLGRRTLAFDFADVHAFALRRTVLATGDRRFARPGAR